MQVVRKIHYVAATTIVRALVTGHGGHSEHLYQALSCATHGNAHAGAGGVGHGKEPRMAVYRGREGVNMGNNPQ